MIVAICKTEYSLPDYLMSGLSWILWFTMVFKFIMFVFP
jgi:hypothetical protein